MLVVQVAPAAPAAAADAAFPDDAKETPGQPPVATSPSELSLPPPPTVAPASGPEIGGAMQQLMDSLQKVWEGD